jgi:PDZ domain-containing secreted protein
MNNLSKKVLLISGILAVALTVSYHLSWADSRSIEEFEQEEEQLVASLVYEIEMEANNLMAEKLVYKIYNYENKLVYESRSSEDQKLKNLLNKSDLLTTIDNISYFKLSR